MKFVGAKEKYNTTLTIAAIKAVYHFILNSDSNDFKANIGELPRLKYHFKELMACYFGFDIFTLSKQNKSCYNPI